MHVGWGGGGGPEQTVEQKLPNQYFVLFSSK